MPCSADVKRAGAKHRINAFACEQAIVTISATPAGSFEVPADFKLVKRN